MTEFQFDSMYQFINVAKKKHPTFYLVFNYLGEEYLFYFCQAVNGKISLNELHTNLIQKISQDTEYLVHSDIDKIPISSFVGVNIPILSYNHIPYSVFVKEVEHVR